MYKLYEVLQSDVVHACSFMRLKYVKNFPVVIIFTTLGITSSKFVLPFAFKYAYKFYSYLRKCCDHAATYGYISRQFCAF